MSEKRSQLSSSLAELNRECEELRELLAAQEIKGLAQIKKVAKRTGGLAIRPPGLRKSIVNLLTSWQAKKPLMPVKETSQVIHAVAGDFVSRKMLVWMFAALTGLPTLFSMVFLWQQTGFLNRQNQLLIDEGRERRSVDMQRVLREKKGTEYRYGTRARQAAFLYDLDFLKSENDPGLDLNAANLSGLSFPKSFWEGNDFHGKWLARFDLRDSYLENCDLTKVSFYSGDLADCTFVNCSLKGATLASFTNGSASGCDFSEADFSFVNLTNSQWERCRFVGAKFTYFTPGQLPQYEVENALAFKGARFHECDFSGAVFDQGAALDTAVFENCVYSKTTVFPPDFDPQSVENGGLKIRRENRSF